MRKGALVGAAGLQSLGISMAGNNVEVPEGRLFAGDRFIDRQPR